jgi:hypothetical protein
MLYVNARKHTLRKGTTRTGPTTRSTALVRCLTYSVTERSHPLPSGPPATKVSVPTWPSVSVSADDEASMYVAAQTRERWRGVGSQDLKEWGSQDLKYSPINWLWREFCDPGELFQLLSVPSQVLRAGQPDRGRRIPYPARSPAARARQVAGNCPDNARLRLVAAPMSCHKRANGGCAACCSLSSSGSSTRPVPAARYAA